MNLAELVNRINDKLHQAKFVRITPCFMDGVLVDAWEVVIEWRQANYLIQLNDKGIVVSDVFGVTPMADYVCKLLNGYKRGPDG